MLYGTGNNRGHILVLFAHFFKVNLKAFHLLSLALYFLKEEFSLVLRVKSNPPMVDLCKLYCISLERLVQYIQYI